MVIVEHMSQLSQPENVTPGNETQAKEPDSGSRERPPIGDLLKKMRGTRTLRQVEADTGITNAYLSNIELGRKHPGVSTLAKLAIYYQVPLEYLMFVAGLQDQAPVPAQQESVVDIQRAYDYVLSDPNVARYPKPPERPSLDMQKFVVQMYEHYTGRKLL